MYENKHYNISSLALPRIYTKRIQLYQLVRQGRRAQIMLDLLRELIDGVHDISLSECQLRLGGKLRCAEDEIEREAIRDTMDFIDSLQSID